MTDEITINDYERYIEILERENASLKKKLVEFADGEAEAKRKIDKSFSDAETKKREALYLYATELNSLKTFAKKWRSYFEAPDGDRVEKSRIIDLLRGFLSDVGLENAKETTEKAAKLFVDKDKKQVAEDTALGDYEFDLDAVINPSGDLDLAELCKELGVYKG